MVEIGFGIIGGIGTRPYSDQPILSGAVSSDHISSEHLLEFCKPIPDISFAYQADIPPMVDCGSFSRDLKNYPLNNPTITSGSYRTFGKSEMVIVFLKLNNYQGGGGHIRFRFHRPDYSVMAEQYLDVPAPDPNWTWWYYWGWACVGRFDDTTGYSVNEITTPGNYTVDVETTWGNAYVSYDVVDTSPQPQPITVSSLYAEDRGNGNVFIQWNQAGAGTVKLWWNSLFDLFDGHDSTNTSTVSGISPGTYNICIEASNKICISLTVVAPLPSCGNISVDSWSVNAVKVAAGQPISFVIRSKNPNASFLVMDTTNPGNPITMITGVTDPSGCYSGNLIRIDGRYTITVNLTNGILLFPIGSKVLQWGEVTPGPIESIGELLKYAPLALGIMVVANVISAFRSR